MTTRENLDILILGCGYTGRRVAQRFLARDARVTATTRSPQGLADLGAEIIRTEDLAGNVRPGMLVLHSIPPDGVSDFLDPLRGKAARVVYLSSTSVYGNASHVDETTVPEPGTELARARIAAERTILEGPWSSLILRPAAIYGPGRGIHKSIQRGEYSLSDTFVSRIHVDDLATLAEAALLSEGEGAWPVADEHPCTSHEIADFCAHVLNLPVPTVQAASQCSPRFSNNRRVDGSAIRRELGITLTYPSYREGVPAALAAENAGSAISK